MTSLRRSASHLAAPSQLSPSSTSDVTSFGEFRGRLSAAARLTALCTVFLSTTGLAAPVADAGTAQTGMQAGSIHSATSRTVWLLPKSNAPYSAKSGLYVMLDPDEGACKAAYGDDWRLRCTVDLGRDGAPVEGVSMKPAVAGRWQWDGSRAIVFFPEKTWEAGASYQIDLSGLRVPARVRLLAKTLRVETPPLTVRTSASRFWLDPDPSASKALSFEFYFSTAPERSTIERNFRLVVPDAAAGLKLGSPQFIWNASGESLFVKVPVESLSDNPVSIRAEIPDAAAKYDEKETATSVRYNVPKGFETASSTVSLPGLSTLFAVESARAASFKNEKLEDVSEVTLRTSINTDVKRFTDALEAYLLPAKLDPQQTSDTMWTDAPVIDDEILSRAEKVSFTTLESGKSDNNIRLRIEGLKNEADTAKAGRFLYLKLKAGFDPAPDAAVRCALAEDWQTVLLLPNLRAEIAFMQPGNLLSLAGTPALSLYASGADKIEWRVARVRDAYLSLAASGYNVLAQPTAENLIETESGAIDLTANCSGNTARFTSIDLSDILKKEGAGLYQVTLVGKAMKPSATDPKKTEETTVATATKKLLITDTALLVKTLSDASIDVFAASFETGEAVVGAEADLLAANGTVLESVRTDSLGRAHFSTTAGLSRERAPAAVALRRTSGTDGIKDLAWLSLADRSNVSTTALGTAGAMSGRRPTSEDGALTAIAFADRGIYRAGETVHFAAIVKRMDFKTHATDDIPLTLRISDSAGGKIAQKTLPLTADGLLSMDWTIPASALPGRLRMDVVVPESDADSSQLDTILASTSVVIEDFVPETLALEAALSHEDQVLGWLKPQTVRIFSTLKSLYGAGTLGRRIKGTASLRAQPQFELPGWSGYEFRNPGKSTASTEPLEFSASTDETGAATIDIPLADIPIEGFGRAQIALEGFEADGGRAVGTSLNFLVSNADAALGLKLTGTPQPLSGLLAEAPAILELVTVGQDLKPKANYPLRITFLKERYVTELASDASGKPVYRDHAVGDPVASISVETDIEGRFSLPLETAAPGRFIVTVESEAGDKLLELPYQTIGNELTRGLNAALPSAEVRTQSDKSAYEAGETIRLSVLSPFEGFGLLTLEADRVLSSAWIKVHEGENAVELTTPEDYAGKSYLRLSLVRLQEAAKRYLEGYAEATLPVTLNRKRHELALDMDVPASAESPKAIPITISSNAPARIALWAVDDGILSLTDYRMPDPLAALLEDRALGVETRQILEKLMPDAAVVGDALPPFGGDFAMKGAAARNPLENPFKRTAETSAVWWSGIVEAGPEPKTYMMTLPEGFNGRVRVMAVGASDSAAGRTVKDIRIAEPLVVAPMLPLAVAPGDTFRVAATISPKSDRLSASNLKGTLSITAPEGFAPQGTSFDIAFEKDRIGGRVESTNFTAPLTPMKASLRFSAELTAEALETPNAAGMPEQLAANRTVELSVRPASISETTSTAGRVKEWQGDKNEETNETVFSVSTGTPLYPFEAETTLTVSRSPLSVALSLADPFARGEKTFGTLYDDIAAAMPYVFLKQNPVWQQSFEKLSALKGDQLLKKADELLEKARSSVEQAVSWDGLRLFPWLEGNLFLTAFAADYLVTAGLRGGVPPELTSLVANRLNQLANRDPLTLDEARSAAYALWVLTRDGTITTPRIASLTALLDERFHEWRLDTTAVFIAGALKRLRLSDEADELLSEKNGRISSARASGSWTPMTAAALTATVFADPVWKGHPKAGFWQNLMMDDLMDAMKGTISPVYAAFASRALLSAAADPSDNESTEPVLACTKYAAGFEGAAAEARGVLAAPGCLTFEVKFPNGFDPKDWYWQIERRGWPVDSADTPAVKNGITIEKRFLNALGEQAETFKAGDVATIEIRARAFASVTGSTEPLTDVAVTDILPGGFELADPPGVGPAGAESFERAEDRMHFVIPSLGSDESVFTYRVRAVTPGQFKLPAVFASSVASPQIRAKSESKFITIE